MQTCRTEYDVLNFSSIHSHTYYTVVHVLHILLKRIIMITNITNNNKYGSYYERIEKPIATMRAITIL